MIMKVPQYEYYNDCIVLVRFLCGQIHVGKTLNFKLYFNIQVQLLTLLTLFVTKYGIQIKLYGPAQMMDDGY